jgi:nucleotide-binding universal stress UspA family protein
MSLTRILVPIDGSRFAEAAIPVARRLSEAGSNAQLHLVLVHESRLALVAAGEFPVGELAEYDLARKHREAEYLAETAAEIRGATFSLHEGRAGPELVAAIEKRHPDLVVMATHGRGRISRLWLGSVAEYVVRHAHVPLLLVRPTDGPLPTFERALVLLDQSREAEAILEVLTAFSQAAQTHLTLYHAVSTWPMAAPAGMPAYVQPLPYETYEGMRAEAQTYLDRVAERLRARGLQVAALAESGTDPASSALERLESGGYDFVALTTHGAGGLKRLLLGSVADKIVRGSQKPVLLLRPTQ